MLLKNLTRNTQITHDLKEAQSIIDKTFGLLRKSNPRSLLFKTRFGIHTFFLKESIDVLVLDNNWQVVKAKTVKPNSIFVYNLKYQIVIELPQNSTEKSKTALGDKLKIRD